MNLAGNYIRITKDKTIGQTSSWVIPYNDRMTLSTTQITRQPIKDFFTNLSDAIQASTNDSRLSTAIGGFNFLSDLFGVKFFNKKYYASSWVGSEPCEVAIKLHFFRGMQNKWSAIQEVYTPILQIYSNTIPDDSLPNSSESFIMKAPLPSTAQAFIDFGLNIVSTVLDTLNFAINTAASVVGVLFKNNNTNTNSNTTLNNALGVSTVGATTSGGKWTIEFGYSDGSDGGKNFTSYLQLSELIVTNSSISFSETLERDGSNYTPIDGDIDLTFKSQLILTTNDIANFLSGVSKTAIKA